MPSFNVLSSIKLTLIERTIEFQLPTLTRSCQFDS